MNNLLQQAYINDWGENWVVEQSRNSQHPAAFWREVADSLLKGRFHMKNNPLTPIGYYAFEWPGAMEYLVERNNRGIDLEKKRRIEDAIIVYELSINDAFFGSHPYDRLRIIYGRKHWYKDAIRACYAYLDLPERAHGQDKPRFKAHLEKLLTKT
jgi:hypothetical protein